MKRINQRIKCGCCGMEVEVPAILSSYRNDCGLDQKPEDISLLPMIQECPHCHYCSKSLKEKVPETVKNRILTDVYHRYMEENSDADRVFLQLQAALIGTEDDKKKAFFNLWSAWYCEWSGKNELAKQFRAKAVEHMEDAMDSAVDMNFMLVYMDSLRQLGEFEKVEEVIQDLETDVKENLSPERAEYKVFMFEKELVKAKDGRAHMVSEAM